MNYTVYSNGLFMGMYPGQNYDEALDNFARDAGYKNYDDLLERVPGSTRDEVKIDEIEEFTCYNTEGYKDEQLQEINREWNERVKERGLTPHTDEYSNQLKWFSDELGRRND